MRRTPISFYSFGLGTVLSEATVEKFKSATECAKQAIAEGYSFIMGYGQNGDQTVLALNKDVQVLSRGEALERYHSDGDKRSLLKASQSKIWIVAPVRDCSDILIPFSGRIRSFRVVKLEDIL